MKELSDVVADTVTLNGGQLVTRIRLQKTFYFLEATGLLPDVGNLGFGYHYYGPYSENLAFAADDAVVENKLKTDVVRGYHSEPYTKFVSERDLPSALSDDEAARVRQVLDVCRRYSSIELEVASSIHFLRRHGHADDAEAETKRRKPLKATDKRIAAANRLLNSLKAFERRPRAAG